MVFSVEEVRFDPGLDEPTQLDRSKVRRVDFSKRQPTQVTAVIDMEWAHPLDDIAPIATPTTTVIQRSVQDCSGIDILPDEAIRPLEHGSVEWMNYEHQRVVDLATESLERARVLGEALQAKKTKVGHGNWLKWVEANLEFGERVAQRYIQIHTRWEELKSKTTHMSDLSFTGALKLLEPSKPAPVVPNNEVQLKARIAELEAIVASNEILIEQLNEEATARRETEKPILQVKPNTPSNSHTPNTPESRLVAPDITSDASEQSNEDFSLGDVACIKCDSSNLVRVGHTPAGKQKLRCKDCGKQFVMGGSRPKEHPPELHQQVFDLYDAGMSYKDIGAVVNIKPNTIATWIYRESKSRIQNGLAFLQLADRLKTTPLELLAARDRPDFAEWSSERDPEHKQWGYRDDCPKPFYVLN